jgi:16S rRNA processing protein RimM
LNVVSLTGEEFGVIDHMLETGANDVMVVKGERERLIPFSIDRIIKSIELEKKQMIVDWDADF